MLSHLSPWNQNGWTFPVTLLSWIFQDECVASWTLCWCWNDVPQGSVLTDIRNEPNLCDDHKKCGSVYSYVRVQCIIEWLQCFIKYVILVCELKWTIEKFRSMKWNIYMITIIVIPSVLLYVAGMDVIVSMAGRSDVNLTGLANGWKRNDCCELVKSALKINSLSLVCDKRNLFIFKTYKERKYKFKHVIVHIETCSRLYWSGYTLHFGKLVARWSFCFVVASVMCMASAGVKPVALETGAHAYSLWNTLRTSTVSWEMKCSKFENFPGKKTICWIFQAFN